jgi:5-methylcytosine-specific restriction endonuclease McrA
VCGATDELHFDRIITYSKDGASIVPENDQVLCARKNLLKRDKIE